MNKLISTSSLGIIFILISINVNAQKTTKVIEYYNENMELVKEQDGYFAYKTYSIDKKGRKRGLSQMYTSNNVLLENIEYKKDKIVGEVIQFNTANKTIESGQYIDKRKVGLWEVRNLDNELVATLAYNEKGEEVGELGEKDPKATIITDKNDIDSPPFFPGGQQKWAEYQKSGIQFSMAGTGGTAAIKMIIWQDGSISNIVPDPRKNTPNFPLTNQLIVLFQNSPKWVPAMKDGKAVPYVMTFSMEMTVTRERVN